MRENLVRLFFVSENLKTAENLKSLLQTSVLCDNIKTEHIFE